MHPALFPSVDSIATKNALTAAETITLHEASALMHRRNVSSLVFTSGHTRRIFTIEHLLHTLRDKHPPEVRLCDLSLPEVPTIHGGDQVLEALERLEDSGNRYLCVTSEADDSVGILTYSDLLRAIDPALLVERKTIGEVIARGRPLTVQRDRLLSDVLHCLSDIESSVIVNEGDRPVGIVTARDAFKAIATQVPIEQPVAQFMSHPLITLDASATLAEALLHLKTHKVKRAVVADDQQNVLGVVTQKELVRYTYGYWLRLLRSHTQELRELVNHLAEKAANFELEALTDPLTLLGNRRHYGKRLAEEIERLERYDHTPFSVLLLDVDHFKIINDRLGHARGDDVLKWVAAILRQEIRGVDAAFRWAGDEFAVLAPHTRLEKALLLAQRIHRHVADLVQLGGLATTLSIGVAEYQRGETEDALFARLDAALYRAKQSGRDRVELAYDVHPHSVN